MLPLEMGWFPEKITNDIDAVILGMHAKQIIQNSSKRRN
jgi:UDP-N-acetylmuramate: L-alanyl-gamma-D-glutamyl-meso-diaminopimelate ligase